MQEIYIIVANKLAIIPFSAWAFQLVRHVKEHLMYFRHKLQQLRPSSDVELLKHVPNQMQMSSNKELGSLTLGSAHEKFDV